MRKPARTKALYAGSFDPITRGHLDILDKALQTFDAVHVAIGTNVKKQRTFTIEQSLDLIRRSVIELWPDADTGGGTLFDGALEIGEYVNQSLMKYARSIGATHVARGPPTSTRSSTCTASRAGSIPPSRWSTSSATPSSCTCRPAPPRSWTSWARTSAGWSPRPCRPPLRCGRPRPV